MNIISEKSLQFLFKKEKKIAIFKFDGNCCICGKKVEIKVIRESAGFGLLGGILYESASDKLIATCIDCQRDLQKSDRPLKIFTHNHNSTQW